MTDEQEAHLERIKSQFLSLLDPKYRKGAEEHKSNLLDMCEMNLVKHALDETLDQATYLITLMEKLGKAAHGVSVIGEDNILQIACMMTMALRDHGPLTKDFTRAFTILTEELGEVGKEILEVTRTASGMKSTVESRRQAKTRAIKELFQLVSVSIYLINNLKDYQGEELND
jgi:hypothetical protein